MCFLFPELLDDEILPTRKENPQEINDNVFHGDRQQNRKIKWKGNQPISKKKLAKKLREEGKPYTGYRRTKEGRVSHDVKRGMREMGTTCMSTFCKKSKFRNCDIINENQRKAIFKSFWEMSWDQRKVYISNMVGKGPVKRKRTVRNESHRQDTLQYHLSVENEKLQVCSKMFLQTLGIKTWFVRYWTDKNNPVPQSVGMASCSNNTTG